MAEKANAKGISIDGIVNTIKQYIRILKLTRKPSNEEFITISKVAGAGILLIGIIGFIIYLIMVPFLKMFIA
ncbi:MAG: preprotein translocase subunit SecE [Methanocella sp. PtaU1.Bin125]|nr:MAG: preprotein translocase subunit SecE [Methanocella sp. PtaU1.Bin125]